MKGLKKFTARPVLHITLTLLLGLSFTPLRAQQIISIERSIVIDADKATILNYVTNLLQDPVWRAEVDSMVLQESPQYGSGAIEYSSFGKNKTITPTFVTEKTDHSVTFETPDTVQYYLASIREIEPLEDGTSLFVYTLKFDNNMTKEISPVRIPKFITKAFYGKRMKKYIKVLQEELEK